MLVPGYFELSNEQRRQLIDVLQVFSGFHRASQALQGMGSLYWQSSKDKRYLYEKRGGVRKSLGRETPALIKRQKEHEARRSSSEAIAKGLRKRLDDMAPVNRALRLGRLPSIAARIVRELDREGMLGSHIIVAGTNALFAYEAATGTIIGSEHVATTDADLLWDTSQSLLLAATGVKREGIMGILKKVDRSFQADYGMNPTNRDGYIVDLLCPETDDFDTMKAGSDILAVQMIGTDWLLKAPQLEQVVIGEDGWPARMVVPEPRTFALHKAWVSRRSDRQPIKRPRDLAHAHLVSALVQKYLQQSFVLKDMPWLPKELKAEAKELKKVKHA